MPWNTSPSAKRTESEATWRTFAFSWDPIQELHWQKRQKVASLWRAACAYVMLYLHSVMRVQQLSWMIHCINCQTDKMASQQTVEINREEFTLHQAKRVPSHLPHQSKTCRETRWKISGTGECTKTLQFFDYAYLQWRRPRPACPRRRKAPGGVTLWPSLKDPPRLPWWHNDVRASLHTEYI